MADAAEVLARLRERYQPAGLTPKFLESADPHYSRDAKEILTHAWGDVGALLDVAEAALGLRDNYMLGDYDAQAIYDAKLKLHNALAALGKLEVT